MIPRKPVSQIQDSPSSVSGDAPSITVSPPNSPDDITGTTITSSPPGSPEPLFYDAPEVVPGTGPTTVPAGAGYGGGSIDYDGEKLTLGPNTDPSASPQVLFNNDPASAPQTVGSSPPYSSIDTDPKSGPQALFPSAFEGEKGVGAGGEAAGAAVVVKKPWWKRKRILGLIALVLLIIVGLAVGLGVGLTMGNKDSSNGDGGDTGNGGDNGSGDDNQGSPDSGNNTTISCDGGLCPALLSTTIHDGQLNVFARTSTNRLAVRTHDGDRWSSGWTDLGEVPGGQSAASIISQPASVAWEVDNDDVRRLDVFVVSSDENRVFGKHKIEAGGRWAEWTDLGPGAGSAVQACRGRDDRIYLWTTDQESGNVTQNFWVPSSNAKRQVNGDDDDEDEDEEDEDESEDLGSWLSTTTAWETASNPAQGPSSSAPGVACRSSSILHDLIWYDRDEDLAWHQAYNDSSSSWGSRRSFEGDWVGDPTVLSYSSLSSSSSSSSSQTQRLDFFGVQSNDEVYTFSWSSTEGYGRMTSLGGSIVSSPASIIIPNVSSSSTRDVFALGSDGKLQHQHYDGTGWAREWEGLNITAWSAPSAVVFSDTAWLFWLGRDGSLMAGSVASDEGGREWADQLEVENLGGDLTLEYFIAESS